MRNQPAPPLKMCLTLGEWPIPILRLRCERCGQIRFHITARLLRDYGPDVEMPNLRHLLMGCGRRSYSDYCGARFSDAVAVDRARPGLRQGFTA